MLERKKSNKLPKEVNKYLDKFALDNWKVKQQSHEKFELIIVIPAIGEFENIKTLLKSLLKNEKKFFSKTLFLFVINNLKSSSAQIKNDNSRSIELLKKIITSENTNDDNIVSEIITAGLQVGLIDASSSGNELPEKDGGVGLARKIGMDNALKLFDFGSERKNILGCLDADCTVSENYIQEVLKCFNERNLSAAHVNFAHSVSGNDEEKAAIICYEIFLRYYLLALKFANSPFGFFTIGSTMFCDAESYIKAQGMNKKKAAEDFYFMEKLAKISKVEMIKEAIVFPSGRGSWRVPFGTGQRVNRFLKGTHDEHTLYSLKSFYVLKDWLNVFMTDETLNADKYLMIAKEINEDLYKFLVNNSFEKSWNKILSNSQNSEQINKQKIIWFDGFRTLKLIHYLRDNSFPNEPMFLVLDEIFLMMDSELNPKTKSGELPSIDARLKYLYQLRKLT
jgi:hypothetical protein